MKEFVEYSLLSVELFEQVFLQNLRLYVWELDIKWGINFHC